MGFKKSGDLTTKMRRCEDTKMRDGVQKIWRLNHEDAKMQRCQDARPIYCPPSSTCLQSSYTFSILCISNLYPIYIFDQGFPFPGFLAKPTWKWKSFHQHSINGESSSWLILFLQHLPQNQHNLQESYTGVFHFLLVIFWKYTLSWAFDLWFQVWVCFFIFSVLFYSNPTSGLKGLH